MIIEFTLTQAEYQEAVRLMRQLNRKGIISGSLWAWSILVAFAIGLFFYLKFTQPAGQLPRETEPGTTSPTTLNELLIPVLPWFLVIAFFWFYVIRAFRKQGWPSHKRLQGPQRMTLDSEGIRWTSPDKEFFVKWSGFIGAKEGSTTFVCADTARTVYVIPRRALTDEQLSEVRALISSNIKTG